MKERLPFGAEIGYDRTIDVADSHVRSAVGKFFAYALDHDCAGDSCDMEE